MHAILLKTGKVLVLPNTGKGGQFDYEDFTVILFDPTESTANWMEADFTKREFQVPQENPSLFTNVHLVPCGRGTDAAPR